MPDPPPVRPTGHGAYSRLLRGIIAGAADLDPAAVLTATVAGAQFGVSLGWVVILCIPVLRSVFAVSARLGLDTRKGLVELIRNTYGVRVALAIALAMVCVNMMMIVGDLVAVSDGLSLLMLQPRAMFLGLVAFVVWYVLVLGDYRNIAGTLGVLSLLLGGYIAAAWIGSPSPGQVLHEVFAPHIQHNAPYLMGIIAVFGSLLTPDILVWQSSSKRELAEESVPLTDARESHAGTFVAVIVSLAAMVAASHLQVADPTSMTTRQAAEALRPLGNVSSIVFSVGIVGSGMVALPLLVASLCFSLSEAMGWKSGLAKAPWEARRFYVLISAALVIAVLIDLNSINLVKLLYWSQLLAGALTVPILWFLLRLGNNRWIMRTLNTAAENFWLGMSVTGMAIANLVFVWMQLVH